MTENQLIPILDQTRIIVGWAMPAGSSLSWWKHWWDYWWNDWWNH